MIDQILFIIGSSQIKNRQKHATKLAEGVIESLIFQEKRTKLLEKVQLQISYSLRVKQFVTWWKGERKPNSKNLSHSSSLHHGSQQTDIYISWGDSKLPWRPLKNSTVYKNHLDSMYQKERQSTTEAIRTYLCEALQGSQKFPSKPHFNLTEAKSSWPMTVANCSIVIKHVNASAVLYPSLHPNYQKSWSYFHTWDNCHRKLSGLTQSLHPKLPLMKQQLFQNYIWQNSRYFC